MQITDELIKLISHAAVQNKRQTVEDYDLCYCPKANHVFTDKYHQEICGCFAEWIPLPIDPVNPDRGVESWIDKTTVDIRLIPPNRLIAYGRSTCVVMFDGKPLEGLLRVYLWQQGVELR